MRVEVEKLALTLSCQDVPGSKPPHTHRAEVFIAGRYLASGWGDSPVAARAKALDMLADVLRGKDA
jgi:hypothetical protein